MIVATPDRMIVAAHANLEAYALAAANVQNQVQNQRPATSARKQVMSQHHSWRCSVEMCVLDGRLWRVVEAGSAHEPAAPCRTSNLRRQPSTMDFFSVAACCDTKMPPPRKPSEEGPRVRELSRYGRTIVWRPSRPIMCPLPFPSEDMPSALLTASPGAPSAKAFSLRRSSKFEFLDALRSPFISQWVPRPSSGANRHPRGSLAPLLRSTLAGLVHRGRRQHHLKRGLHA